MNPVHQNAWQFWMLSFLAAAGTLLGILLLQHINSAHWVAPWALLTLALIALVAINKTHFLQPIMARLLQSSPWPWLVAAIIINSLVLFFGQHELGVTRTFGNDYFSLRASLWSMIPMLVFLTIFSQQTHVKPISILMAMLGIGLYAMAGFMQRDLFSLVILIVLAFYFGLQSKNKMKIWLPLSAGLSIPAGLLYALSSIPIWKRLVDFNHSAQTDPEGHGFTLHQTQSAFEQAGLWGTEKLHLINSATTRLELDWSTLPHLSLWLGNVTMASIVLIIIIFLALLFLQIRSANPTIKPLLVGGWLLLLVSQLFAIMPSFGLLPFTGHYGLLLLTPGEITLVAALLLALSHSARQTNNP